jgi:hypothetical protein
MGHTLLPEKEIKSVIKLVKMVRHDFHSLSARWRGERAGVRWVAGWVLA